jgi:hypothetical protein
VTGRAAISYQFIEVLDSPPKDQWEKRKTLPVIMHALKIPREGRGAVVTQLKGILKQPSCLINSDFCFLSFLFGRLKVFACAIKLYIGGASPTSPPSLPHLHLFHLLLLSSSLKFQVRHASIIMLVICLDQ